ncbi:MAG: hypothetical protein AAGN15_05245 [Cyanobacteria bacterium J06581_3]
MTTKLLHSYNAVIQHTLENAIRLAEQSPKIRKRKRRGIAGFCQLQGPTGGGKSSSLYRKGFNDAVIPALDLIKNENRQAILVTHRWNILHDILNSTVKSTSDNSEPFSVSVLYAQSESVVSAVTQTPLPHEDDLQPSDIPDPISSIEYLSSQNLLVIKGLKEKLIKSCKEIAVTSRSLNSQNNHLPIARKYLAREKEDLGKACASLERILLKNMSELEQEVTKANPQSESDKELSQAAAKRLKAFRDNKWIRRIFPAICWHDDRQHLLIMTTQKLFSSFYDGQNKVRMSHSDLSGHVIFIDEFDYQSDVLQQLLAQDQAVQEPPECLGQLLESGKRLLKRMQYVTTEPVSRINERLKAFLDELEDALLDKNIDLSDLRAFVIPKQDYEGGKAFKKQFLFRSDHLVTSSPVTMRRVAHGYEIKEREIGKEPDPDTVDVSDFLRLMEKFIRQFSLMLSNLAATENEARDYISKLSCLLFDAANDYRPSYYSSTLPNLSLYSLPRTDLDELRRFHLIDSNILPNTHANVFGLTSWLLYQNASEVELDPTRIQIRRAFLPTTPEGLLLSLSSRNLVFALSATSYIERAIGHFDTRWLTSALRYIAEARTPTITKSFLGIEFGERPKSWFKRPIPYVQDDNDLLRQHEMISQISQAKAAIRKTTLQLHISDFSQNQQTHEYQEMLAALSSDFFHQEGNPVSKGVQEYRQKLLCMLLDIVNIAGDRSEHKGQLAFVNSTKYLRKWLHSQEAKQSREWLTWLKFEGEFSSILSNDTTTSNFDAETFNNYLIPVNAHGSSMLLCLLTAECQKKTGFSSAYQAAFDTGRTVLVLTQTASATNGINLDYSLPDFADNNASVQMDLTCLYLLEAQHFYFSSFEENDGTQDRMAHAGIQLRNLDKLCRTGELSRTEHRRNILPLMTNARWEINALNTRYKQLNDYVRNTAANVQQQVGRLERTWRKVPKVDIYVSSNLAETLTRFASIPMFVNNRRLVSNLNVQLLEALLEQKNVEEDDFLTQLLTPTQPGEMAIEIIDNTLVPAIRDSRKNSNNVDELRRVWFQLGRAVLQYDYAWNPTNSTYGIEIPLRDWACFEKPTESSSHKDIWYDPTTWQFFSSPGKGRKRYNPERLYEYIQRDSAIVDWFNRKGYRTSMVPFANDGEQRYAFHPVVVQRLLQGRLGEEAIRALLHKEGIKTHTDLNNPKVLELYDFSVSGTSFRVDAKFWSQSSQDRADDEYQNWLAGGAEPTTAPLGLISKLSQVRKAEGEGIKLAILNFVAIREDAPLLGFDYDLNPTPTKQADILILSGCVTNDPIASSTPGFQDFIRLVS